MLFPLFRLHATRTQSATLFACGALALSATLGILGSHACASQTPHSHAPKGPLKPIAVPTSVHFAYRWKPGDTFHYNVLGLFTGHFPPFAQPNSPAINLKAKINYLATVKKQSAEGVDVEFSVEDADLSLLEKDPGPDAKIDPDTETPFPLPLSQVQKALDVTATIRSDGSVAKVSGGNAVPLNIGFELRKLFLLMLPITFPDHAVKPTDEWTYADGVLGNKPGQVEYKGRLVSLGAKQRDLALQVEQNATATVNEMRDKDQKITDTPANSVDTTTGTVTLNGDFQFLALPGTTSATLNQTGGRLDTGRMTMNVQLTRKRATPDPNNPTEPLETNIDVKARLFVKRDEPVSKPHTTGSAQSARLIQKENMR